MVESFWSYQNIPLGENLLTPFFKNIKSLWSLIRLGKATCTIPLYSELSTSMLDYCCTHVICDVYVAPHKYAIRCTAIHHQPLSFMRRWKCQKYFSLGIIFKNKISVYLLWFAEAVRHASWSQMAVETFYYVSALHGISTNRENKSVFVSSKASKLLLFLFLLLLVYFISLDTKSYTP